MSRASKSVSYKGRRPKEEWIKGIKERRESVIVDKGGVDVAE